MKPRAHVLSVKFLAVKFLAGLLALCCALGARDARAQAGHIGIVNHGRPGRKRKRAGWW